MYHEILLTNIERNVRQSLWGINVLNLGLDRDWVKKISFSHVTHLFQNLGSRVVTKHAEFYVKSVDCK